MSKDAVFDTVKSVVVDQLGVDEDEVTREADFINDLGADSFDIVELIMVVEEEYEIDIPDEDAEKLLTVGGAVDYIKSRIS